MVDFHDWQWYPSHKQVYGSDTESNVTLKVTRVGRFSLYVERLEQTVRASLCGLV